MSTPTDLYETDYYEGIALGALDLVLREIIQTRTASNNSCTSELEVLDLKVKNIETAVAVIAKVAKAQIARYRRYHNQLASPILRLPNEIISEIFIYLRYSMPLTDVRAYYRNLGSIRRVCSQFQRISDATPRLWGLICGKYPGKGYLRKVAMLLEKSKSTLLDINIEVANSWEPDQCWAALNLLLEHSQRWRTFECHYGYQSDSQRNLDLVLSSFTNIATIRAPRLQEFVLRYNYGSESLLYPGQVDLFRGVAPSLQHLDLRPILISWNSGFLSGLKFLRLKAWDGAHPPTSEQYLTVLLSCPSLKELHLRGRDERFREGESGAVFHNPIILSELETLSLEFLHPTTIKSLLSSIKANPSDMNIVFSSDLKDRWEEVINATLLDSDCSHLLERFISSPHRIGLMQDIDYESDAVKAWMETDDGISCCFTCVFASVAVAVYRALFQPTARETVRTLTLEFESALFEEHFGYRELLEGLVGLRELQLSGDVELQDNGYALGWTHLKSHVSPLILRIYGCSSMNAMEVIIHLHAQ
ncbi:hypothetical protein FRC02_003393 [Tulasnella sp. 418]|nr:hypothetical protein FRC02_003393 [Tulasnella sp. 418]